MARPSYLRQITGLGRRGLPALKPPFAPFAAEQAHPVAIRERPSVPVEPAAARAQTRPMPPRQEPRPDVIAAPGREFAHREWEGPPAAAAPRHSPVAADVPPGVQQPEPAWVSETEPVEQTQVVVVQRPAVPGAPRTIDHASMEPGPAHMPEVQAEPGPQFRHNSGFAGEEKAGRSQAGASVRIGTIEVHVSAPPPPAPPAHAQRQAGPTHSSPLSRGYLSRFGLRQG